MELHISNGVYRYLGLKQIYLNLIGVWNIREETHVDVVIKYFKKKQPK